jgi:hypothetical protein
MNTRARDYLTRAMACERMAGIVMDEAIQAIYLDLAAQWRDMARQGELFQFDRRMPPPEEAQ